MEIMMFVVADPEIDGSDVDQEAAAEWDRVMAERGVLKRAMRLRPVDEAKTVRVRGGEVIVTDGPFTESKELIAGFTIIQAKSLAEAIEWVKRAPNLSPDGEAEVEIRKVMDIEDFGEAFTPNAEIAKVKIQ